MAFNILAIFLSLDLSPGTFSITFPSDVIFLRKYVRNISQMFHFGFSKNDFRILSVPFKSVNLVPQS